MARDIAAAALLLAGAASWAAPAPAPASALARALTPTRTPPQATSPEAERCRAHGSIDTCYDALRRSPSDPTLLTALGDAFSRANRPPDALRTYRRAAALAPTDRGLTAKIAALETKPTAKRARTLARADGATRRYSNAAPESQSH